MLFTVSSWIDTFVFPSLFPLIISLSQDIKLLFFWHFSVKKIWCLSLFVDDVSFPFVSDYHGINYINLLSAQKQIRDRIWFYSFFWLVFIGPESTWLACYLTVILQINVWIMIIITSISLCRKEKKEVLPSQVHNKPR